MILTDAIQLVKDLTQIDLGNFSGEAPSNANITAQINRARREVSRRIFIFDPSVTLTLTASEPKYNLRTYTSVVSRPVIRPYHVIISGNPLLERHGCNYGLWTWDELNRSYPGWRTDTAGTPTKAAWTGPELILHPAPDSTVAALSTHYIAGQVLSKDLSATDDASNQLPEPVEIHEDICLMAAVWAESPTATEEEAIARLLRYNAKAMDRMNEIERENRAAVASLGVTHSRSYI